MKKEDLIILIIALLLLGRAEMIFSWHPAIPALLISGVIGIGIGDTAYFTALNLPREFAFAEPAGAAEGMRIPYDNYDFMAWHHDTFDVGHFFAEGALPWVKDLWQSGLEGTPWNPVVQRAFLRLRQTEIQAPQGQDMGRWLDSMTLKEFYVSGIRRETFMMFFQAM